MSKYTRKTEPETDYVLTAWRGMKRYQCRLCQFDTLEEHKFVDHFARAHPPLEVIDGFVEADPPTGESVVED